MYYLNCFFIYSIIGYIIETCYGIISGNNYQSGVLNGPWAMIYGFGGLLIILFSNYLFKHLHLKRWIETIIVFFIMIVILSVMELIGGYLIEFLLGITFWDYTNYEYNLGKYICLETSLIWGILSLILIYIIEPFLRNFILKIPRFVTFLLVLFFIIDLTDTILSKI